MAPTEETMASRPSAISDSNAIISPTSPTSPTSPQSMVLPTDMGWKITIKNTDGTSNEVTLEPKAPVHTNTMREMPFGEVADPEKVQGSIEKKPATLPVKLKLYLIIQYVLNAILAVVIIVIMALTLAEYNSTKSMPGAWPPNPVLSPTFIMLVVSCVNVLMDAINILVQCCGVRVLRTVAVIVTKVRTVTGVVTAIMPAIAAGLFKFANNSTNNTDLWSWSCNAGNTTSAEVTNAQSTVCSTNGVAYPLQLLQIGFQLLSLLVPMYGKWLATKQAAVARGPNLGGEDGMDKGDADMKQNVIDEAENLIEDSKPLSGM